RRVFSVGPRIQIAACNGGAAASGGVLCAVSEVAAPALGTASGAAASAAGHPERGERDPHATRGALSVARFLVPVPVRGAGRLSIRLVPLAAVDGADRAPGGGASLLAAVPPPSSGVLQRRIGRPGGRPRTPARFESRLGTGFA